MWMSSAATVARMDRRAVRKWDSVRWLEALRALRRAGRLSLSAAVGGYKSVV